MTLLTAVGDFSGDVQNGQLEITVWDNTFATINRDAALTAALDVAPSSYSFGGATLYPTGSPTVQDLAHFAIKFGISYEVPELDEPTQTTPPEAGTFARRANAVAKSITRFNFRAPVGVFDIGGEVTSSYSRTKWKIDLKTDDRDRRRAEGTTFEPLPETRTLDYYVTNLALTDSYLNSVEALVVVGAFNDDDFFGNPAGSVQIVRFSCSERSSNDWELSFGFGRKPLEEDVPYEGITVPAIRGCDHCWTLDREVYNESAKLIELQAKLAIVGQVWPLMDFSVLVLPGA